MSLVPPTVRESPYLQTPMQGKQKLFLLDAYALIYRAHFAFIRAPRVNSKGQNTSATFGFLNTLLEVLDKEKPTHIGVAFDTAAPTFRHEQYVEYKANRDAQPEDIGLAVPYVRRLLQAMHIPILELDGWEADDVVGTLAKQAEGLPELEVYMMTPDKDYGQLVRENVFLYKPSYQGKGVEVMGPKEVCEKWGIERVDQVIDMLGLMGDAVDNIPGLPGVGEKTAAKLLEEYGSMEGVFEHADEIKGKLGEKVRDNKEQGLLSKHLATIACDAPIALDLAALVKDAPDREAIIPILDELEFRTIKRRLFPDVDPPQAAPGEQGSLFAAPPDPSEDEPQDAPKGTLATTVHDYHAVTTKADRAQLIKYLLLQDEYCFDSETTSLQPVEAEIVGLSFCYRAGEAYYVPFPPDRAEATAILEEFRPVFESETILKIAQNLKYDLSILAVYGLDIKGPVYDTMLAHYLIQPDMRHNMDVLADAYLNYQPVSITELIGKKGKEQGTMADVPLAQIKEYAGEDADITFQLKQTLAPELENRGQQKLFEEVEMPLVEVLAKMERTGVKVDEQVLRESSKELEVEIRQEQEKVWELAGVEFNLGSPKQLGEILFDHMKLEGGKKTKSGQFATGEEVLSKLAADNPIIQHILDFRELSKLKSTYVDALPEMISKKTGRIHTNYAQAVAATGRLSSQNPNLQNIPIRTSRGREIRKAFVPGGEGRVLLSADYSQVELRIMASFSGDESMIEAFRSGEDIHKSTAAKVFGVNLEDVTSEQRSKAKMVNFGIIYGISAFGLAQRLGISRTEAAEIIEAYFTKFPAVKCYMDEMIQRAREKEYVETILGRRRYLADINSRNQNQRGFAERNAINAPIQGSAADLIKLAMIHIHAWMKTEKLKSQMVLQVHDELVFDAFEDELPLLKEKVIELMSGALDLKVPLLVEAGSGPNWLVAH